LHAAVADHEVFDHEHGVAHVEVAVGVGRRHDDGERFFGGGEVGLEGA
jgi:hypothetical protein